MNAGAARRACARASGRICCSYYDYARKNDLYLSFAVTPASGRKSADLFPGQQRDDPNLQVVAEDDAGVTVSGMKMLATSAVYADEILIGNLTPIDDKFKSEAITAALPLNAPGLSLWSRQPYAQHVAHEADYPMSYRFDETDSVLVCDRVKIPWERVFLHNDAAMSRRIYIETPANCYQNHQSNIRFWAKMGLIVGLASRICQANGTDKIPAVRETLGRLAALEALIGGLVHGQIEAWEEWPEGFATPNRRIMYAALNWCQEHHTEIVDTLRTLLGGYPLVMPASIDVMTDDALRDTLRALVEDAVDRGGRAAQALQARLGHRRHRVRRPPHALREILRRQFDRGAQPERPRGAVAELPRHGRPAARQHRGARSAKLAAQQARVTSRAASFEQSAAAVGHCPLCGGNRDGTLATKRARRMSREACPQGRVCMIRKILTAVGALAAVAGADGSGAGAGNQADVRRPEFADRLGSGARDSIPGSSRSRRPARAASRSRCSRRRP